MFSRMKMRNITEKNSDYKKIKELLSTSDAVIIGVGSGLSTAAGYTYEGERFDRYFRDFKDKYHFPDMYTGGFYPYSTEEEKWAFWSRYVYINRYMRPPKPVYEQLYGLIKDKDYFVLTTNVDHCFQRTGFDKKRLFYTQGDYGLLQCSVPCHQKTYDNEDVIKKMVLSQGYEIKRNGDLLIPDGKSISMSIPSDLVPYCPLCGKPMEMNLRSNDTFVEDEGWHRAAERYSDFIRRHERMKILFLELGVGFNTPGIIKYSFWNMTYKNTDATYVCVNYKEAGAPKEIRKQSICIDSDIADFLETIQKKTV